MALEIVPRAAADAASPASELSDLPGDPLQGEALDASAPAAAEPKEKGTYCHQ